MLNIEIITEKNYPITKLWMFKEPIFLAILIVISLFSRYNPFYIILILVIYLIANYLVRANFHYSLEEKFLSVRQGVISKKQRNLPYGVIQNIFLRRSIFDRILGLSSLIIENASQSGGKKSWWNKRGSFNSGPLWMNVTHVDKFGSSENKINIPGLKKQDAEALKNIILQKMKDNPVEELGL